LSTRRNIAILGSTGSIGRSTLEVLSHLSEHFRVTCLSAHRNIALLEEQAKRFTPSCVAVADETDARHMRKILGSKTEVLSGESGLLALASRDDIDILLNALVGFAGLRPTLRAIETGKDIALANKETLVVAGEIVMQKAREQGVRILPVDSEHSAIVQCLQGEDLSSVSRLILTASGGPFLHMEEHRMRSVTVQEALTHPVWKMGNKITIDSATLMNKGLEVIEACRLFDLPPARIEVLIHPQSIIHSMVEFNDGSIKAQLGQPDMRMPIQYALMYPHRPPASFKKIDFRKLSQLTFGPPDTDRFRCLPLAFKALEMGGTAPTVLNAANEVAVQLFLEERVRFTEIPDIIEHALQSHTPAPVCTIEEILAADKEIRRRITETFKQPRAHHSGDSLKEAATL
jgi:1-deoxy-D-xylulose-5-phosphate reductoisomerase